MGQAMNWKRVAIIIPVGAVLNMFLLFGLFMNPYSQQIIFSEEFGQSGKLVGVWKTMEPVPTLESLAPALLVTPAIYSFVFAVLYDSIPGKRPITKGISYGIILWALIAVFFELFAPNGLFGEPAHLLAYELFLWLVGLISVSVVISLIYQKK
jgi:hypothetical protein